MKTAFRLIIAAMAASVALVSCSKDDLEPKETEIHPLVTVTDGSRVIKVSFGPETKSTLDGFQPKFTAGDTIAVSNGVNAPERCIVKVDDSGNAFFSTNLMGALTAVYPASAADINSNGKQIDGIKVLVTQSGKFADANICLAEIGDAATTANFKNEVAILKFYVDKSIGVKKITVSSSTDLAAGGSKSITVDPEGDATINTITDDPQKRICYVAVLPGIKSDLKFSSETTTQGSVERQLTADTNLKKNGMYNAFIPYYIDLGKAGKWAYCNIGAFLPEEPGKYFAWGDTEGQTWNGSSWSSEFATIEGNPDTLKLENDAAHVIWGGSWRMPTKAQLDTLAASTKEWNTETKGYKLYTSSADISIFLPAAGSSANMSQVGTSGEYWSSSLNTEDEKTLAYKLGISKESATTSALSRTVGATIRPFRHIPVESIELNKAKDTVKINDVATLIATIYPANASDTLVTWTSSNTDVATVDQRGTVTGVAGGTATITARIIDLNGTEKSTTCEVKVPAKITSVTLNKTSIAALKVGSDETLSISQIDPTTAIIVSTTWSSNNTSIATVDQSGKVTGKTTGNTTIKVTVIDVYDIEVTQTCSVEVKPKAPEGAISGAFSISESEQVYFAKGNLVATIDASGNPTNWTFATNQYDFVGNNGANLTIGSGAGNVDLFGWSTDGTGATNYKQWGINTSTAGNNSYQGNFIDWGIAYCTKNNITPNTTWRTLTSAQWIYILETRSGNRYAMAKVNGVIGLLIFPDGYSLPSGYTSEGGTGMNKVNTLSNTTSNPDPLPTSNIPNDTWKSMEAAGVVFLPNAGYRGTYKDADTYYSGGTSETYYWSATAKSGGKNPENYANCLVFTEGSKGTGFAGGSKNRYSGSSVRLVTDVE